MPEYGQRHTTAAFPICSFLFLLPAQPVPGSHEYFTDLHIETLGRDELGLYCLDRICPLDIINVYPEKIFLVFYFLQNTQYLEACTTWKHRTQQSVSYRKQVFVQYAVPKGQIL